MNPYISNQEKSVLSFRFLFYLFLVALVLRIIFFAFMRDFPLLYFQSLDEKYYIEFGKIIAQGSLSGRQETFFMDPLYGYFLGVIFSVFGDNLANVRLIQIFLDSLNVLIIFAIGRRVWDQRAGAIAAIIWATYTVSFYYTLILLKVTLAVTGMLFFIWLLLEVVENHQAKGWFLIGIVAGILNYIRANFILIIPFTLIFYLIIERPKKRLYLKNSMFFLAGVMVLIIINSAYTYYRTGSASVMITSSGLILYCCNHPDNTTGIYDVPSFSRSQPITTEKDFHKEAERRIGHTLSAAEASKYWRNDTLRGLIDHPSIIPVLFFNKLKWIMANYEIPMNQSYHMAADFVGVNKWPLPNYAFLFAFGVPGLTIATLRRKRARWLLIPVLTIVATLLIFYVASRLRMPMVPFLTIGTGIYLSVLYDWTKKKEDWGIVILVLGTSCLLFSISMLIQPPASDGHKEFGLAKAFYFQNNLTKAESLALTAIKKYPDNLDLYILLGRIAREEDQFDQSIKYYQDAMKITSDNFTVNYDLAMLYMNSGKPEYAISYFRQCLTLKHHANSMFNLARAYDACGDSPHAKKYYKEFLESAATDDPGFGYAQKRLAVLR